MKYFNKNGFIKKIFSYFKLFTNRFLLRFDVLQQDKNLYMYCNNNTVWLYLYIYINIIDIFLFSWKAHWCMLPDDTKYKIIIYQVRKKYKMTIEKNMSVNIFNHRIFFRLHLLGDIFHLSRHCKGAWAPLQNERIYTAGRYTETTMGRGGWLVGR